VAEILAWKTFSMKVLVLQSFRDFVADSYVGKCLASVQAWARQNGFDYEFIGDDFFAVLPDWCRQTLVAHRLQQTDIARLLQVRRALNAGYQRAIWVDADVIVFNPALVTLDGLGATAFCREVWLHPIASKQYRYDIRVNNAVCMFDRDSSLLDFYIGCCFDIVRHRGVGLGHLDLSVEFLTPLHRLAGWPVFRSVGLFGPLVLRDIVSGGGSWSSAYSKIHAHPLGAANLCASLIGKRIHGIDVDEELFERSVDTLLCGCGSLFNSE